jgi:DNA-binding NarL/FixJ family response regulator
MNKTTIAIIDDHKIVRHGLKELLEKLGNYSVIIEFESGEAFVNALPLEKNIDVFILDYSMKKMNGIDVLKHLETLDSEHKVLLLSQNIDQNIISEAFEHGARGFLDKNCTAHDLKNAIDNITKIGYNNISEILKKIKTFSEPQKNQKIELSAREQAFLTLVCDEKEYTYEKMSEIIGVSVKSIDVYRAALFDKFNVKSKVGLVLYSFQNKLTEPFL